MSAWHTSHAPARAWRAGAWALELRDDELADVAYDGVVLLRAVRAVVRDRDWDTATTLVDGTTETESGLELAIRSAGLGSSFAGVLRVQASGRTLAVECELESAAPFETNRTGLVVLHPPSLAGTPLRVTHPEGEEEEETRFPRAISPHQPVRDIAGLAWRQAGLDVRLELSGDVFEMEDQRNWTDASFKTYSRPLELPFPYRVEAGERIRQALRLTVRGGRRPSAPAGTRDRIELSPTGAAVPRIAVGASTAPDPAPPGGVRASAVLVELDLGSANRHAALERAAASGAPLDVRLVLDDARPDALEEAVGALRGLPLARVAAFRASGPAAHVSDVDAVGRLRAALLRAALLRAGLTVPVLGGARSHFTELNRERHRLPDDLDGVTFALTPLFHSRSTEQLVESVAMQRLVARQGVAIAGGRPLHIGPVTLRPRFNNVATTPPRRPVHADLRDGYGAELLDAADPRQSAPELAAWTVASAAALTVAGVATLTYFEEWGPRGLRSAAGEPYPVAGAIEALRDLEGAEALTGASADGLVRAIGGRRGDAEVVLVANLASRERAVVVATPTGERRLTLPPLAFQRTGASNS